MIEIRKGGGVIATCDFERVGDSFEVSGQDPYFSVGFLEKDAAFAGFEIFYFPFQAQSVSRDSDLDFYWSEGRGQEEEVRSVRFRVPEGKIIVPMYASMQWHRVAIVLFLAKREWVKTKFIHQKDKKDENHG